MEEEQGRPERRGWHFKRELSLGDLYAVAGAAALAITSYHILERRQSLAEQSIAVQAQQITQIIASQKAVDSRQDEEALRTQSRMDRALEEINRKLDRLMERRGEARK